MKWPWHKINTWNMEDSDQVPAIREMEKIIHLREWFKIWIRGCTYLNDGKMIFVTRWIADLALVRFDCPTCSNPVKLVVKNEAFTRNHSCKCRTQFNIDLNKNRARIWRIYRIKPGPKPGKQLKIYGK